MDGNTVLAGAIELIYLNNPAWTYALNFGQMILEKCYEQLDIE